MKSCTYMMLQKSGENSRSKKVSINKAERKIISMEILSTHIFCEINIANKVFVVLQENLSEDAHRTVELKHSLVRIKIFLVIMMMRIPFMEPT